MRAWQMTQYGPPESMAIVELPRPEPGPRQLLVRVRATSVNPVDWKMASGRYRPFITAPFPFVPGFDVAGEVVACGAEAARFAVGDRVYARLNQRDGGASAEFALINLEVAAKMPDGLSFEQAAAIPLAGMTALQALRDKGGLPLSGASGRVLVIGASGGVGTFAVQIARRAGAEVIGVCSGRNADLVRSLGAHDILDYTKEPDVGRCAPYDIALDCVGAEPFGTFKPHLQRTGVFVSVFPMKLGTQLGTLTTRLRPGPRCFAHRLTSRAEDLDVLSGLVAEGALRSVVAQTFPFTALPDAHRASMSGRTAGKIVVAGLEDGAP